MKIKLLLALLFGAVYIHAQNTFVVENFSPNFFGKIFIADTSEVFSKGWIAVYEKKSNQQIIKVTSDELALSLHDGKLLANIKQMPYGEQSLIMYEDYNFDGKKDFAICDGQNSCYHGPSFNIYLATKNGFSFNENFTKLAQDFCGMFQVDAKNKQLNTMTKDGCCWHQFTSYKIVNNYPQPILIDEEDQRNIPFSTSTTKKWNGKKMISSSFKTLDLGEEGIKIVLSFKVQKKQKEVILFNTNDRILTYALLEKDGNVEFSFPAEIVYQNPDFDFNEKENTIGFKNKKASYKIYDNSTGLGIQINIDGKEYNWIGDKQSKKGSLRILSTTTLDNVENVALHKK
jgi:hypothetical protein